MRVFERAGLELLKQRAVLRGPHHLEKGSWLLCGISKVLLICVFSWGNTIPDTYLATLDPYSPYSVGKTWAIAQEDLDLKEGDCSGPNA